MSDILDNTITINDTS